MLISIRLKNQMGLFRLVLTLSSYVCPERADMFIMKKLTTHCNILTKTKQYSKQGNKYLELVINPARDFVRLRSVLPWFTTVW